MQNGGINKTIIKVRAFQYYVASENTTQLLYFFTTIYILQILPDFHNQDNVYGMYVVIMTADVACGVWRVSFEDDTFLYLSSLLTFRATDVYCGLDCSFTYLHSIEIRGISVVIMMEFLYMERRSLYGNRAQGVFQIYPLSDGTTESIMDVNMLWEPRIRPGPLADRCVVKFYFCTNVFTM